MGFFALSLLLAASLAGADDCTSVRLDRDGGSLERIPEPVQYGISICHAFAATQLVDAYRASHGDPGPLSSALDVAIGTAVRTGSKSIEIGKVCEAFQTAKTQGSCDASAFAGSIARTYGDYPTSLTSYDAHRVAIQALQEIYENNKRSSEKGSNQTLGDLTLKLYEIDPEGRFTATQIEELSLALASSSASRFLDGALNRACSRPGARRPLELSGVGCRMNGFVSLSDVAQPAADLVKREGYRGWLTYLNRRLSRGASTQPIAAGMCYNVVRFDAAYRGVKFLKSGPQVQPGCLVHFPLVIGRRKNGDRCEYLLRNFRGTQCNWPYAKPWECERDGGLWMDGEALARNIHSVYEIGTPRELAY
jgi:hypothetical protein